jgi:hypothetical protein
VHHEPVVFRHLFLLSTHLRLEPARFSRNPSCKLGNVWVGEEEFDRIPLSLKLFFGEDRVNLGVAGTADSDSLLDRLAIKLPLVSLVRMTGPRNQVMPRQRLFPAANSANGVHR